MADAHIRAVITAEDRASKVVSSFGDRIQHSLLAVTAATAAAGVALDRFTGFLGGTLDAANKNQAALSGLSSVTRAFGGNVDTATKAASDLASDGLMSVTEAATGLKNLLASGFSLDQAIVLMKRFKDSAAFGRQSALTFGQAVTSATEGIKNGNSILVDNAGVTKNLSVILEEAGLSAQDLMRATTDTNVRMALFNGILKETNPQLGDAAKLTELFAGKQAQVTAQTTILKERIGTALQPVLLSLLNVITPIIERISAWVQEHPKLAATIAVGTVLFLGMVAALGALATAVVVLGAAFGSGLAAVLIGAGAAIAGTVAFIIVNFERLKGWFQAFPGWLQSALSAVPGIITRAFLGPLTGVLDTLNRVGEKFRNIPGLGSLSNIGKIPGFAGGVTNFSGGMAVVGEKGPELVNLPRGSSVTPNHQLGGATVNLNVNVGTYVGTEMEKRRLAKELFDSLQDLASSQNRSLSQLLGG